jgi:benzoyl-CoA reductase/2-hydroxyglutaryl-CoA dehydratase subunit BcrC/BadD/HgdB
MKGIAPLRPEVAERAIGLTTTVPVEVIYAAGLRPIDLNNVFITSGIADELVEEAERAGFPRNSCAWNKGIYSAARRLGLRRIAPVVQGDCANTHALVEMLEADGVTAIPFAFPYDPADAEMLELSLERFCAALGTTRRAAEGWKVRLDAARAPALRVDELAWREDRATGEEQHLALISCSDFFGDLEEWRGRMAATVAEIEARPPMAAGVRLALIGIPPICDGFFGFLESHGARVVFNEIPRQFAMPGPTADLAEQYARYTYPYDIFHRLADIAGELARRRVQGVVHYVQSFCFRQVQDAIVRRRIDLPLLTLEGDRPGLLDMRTETRIEAFLEMVKGRG